MVLFCISLPWLHHKYTVHGTKYDCWGSQYKVNSPLDKQQGVTFYTVLITGPFQKHCNHSDLDLPFYFRSLSCCMIQFFASPVLWFKEVVLLCPASALHLCVWLVSVKYWASSESGYSPFTCRVYSEYGHSLIKSSQLHFTTFPNLQHGILYREIQMTAPSNRVRSLQQFKMSHYVLLAVSLIKGLWTQ